MTLTVVVGWQLTQPAPAPAAITPLITEGADGPPRTDDDAVLAAAEAAMEAWGSFATTGDVSVLETHFDPAGPQYRQLAGEAPDRAADPARYRLTLTDADARPESGGGGWIVEGEVLMTRDGEPAGHWRWRLHLRHHPEHARRVWTAAALIGEGDG